jgi:hypothetical protein
LEPTAALFFVHDHDVGVKPEQFAESETAPPALVDGL